MTSAAWTAPRAPSGERGAASVLAVGIVGATVALAAMVLPVTAAFAASQRAAGAADAAALAAADALSGAVPGLPCDLAGRIAARNGAALASCETGGPVASVTVTVPSFAVELRAGARAGPPGWHP
ncbi:helicase [Agromyces mariniharenae]|uniref:Helicase n=1 Tax=Agromyces mariniharenae TaxID=2604423 RepID=A0A5S4V093_9MICO|nr:Rv3654c family TadE-like protein [Agromyces mariniharenae]TYL52624.1 helicase [Agromyces mariniharenae]